MSDQQITCSDCGSPFVFTASEQQFYESKGLSGPPKRCKPCRVARKSADGGRPTHGASGAKPGGWGRPAPRDGGSYDRPRGDAPRPPRGDGGWAPRGRPDGAAPRAFDRSRAPAGRGDARPPFRAREGGGYPRAAPQPGPASVGDRSRLEVREAPRGEFRPRSQRGLPVGVPPPAPRAEPAARPPKKKKERPKYDVTCNQCGAAAQVPFEPIAGRDIFCQPCYRARRGVLPVAGAVEPAAVDDGVAAAEGIVEEG